MMSMTESLLQYMIPPTWDSTGMAIKLMWVYIQSVLYKYMISLITGQMNNKLQKSAGVLHPMPKLWCQGADWDRPNNIITLTDCFSKWAEAALHLLLTKLQWECQSSSLSSHSPERGGVPILFMSAAWSQQCTNGTIPSTWATSKLHHKHIRI